MTVADTDRVDDAQAGKGGGHLRLVERVCLIFVKVPEGSFKLLELFRGQTSRVPCRNLRGGMSITRGLASREERTWLVRNAIFFVMLCCTSSSSNSRSSKLNTVWSFSSTFAALHSASAAATACSASCAAGIRVCSRSTWVCCS